MTKTFTFPSHAVLAMTAALLLPITSVAQDAAANFPNKTITLVVPYAPGGSSDTRARQVAQKMSQYLGQPVIVDNKAGANGNIGTNAVAKAAPDGYTIGIGNLAPMVVNKHMMASMPFDSDKDLQPVILLEKGPTVLFVNAEKSPYKDLKSMVTAMKAAPGKLSYASAGSGGAYHLAGEMFKASAGVFAVHIPYRSGGMAINDILAGQVEYMFDMAPAVLPQMKSNPPRLRPLAAASAKRLPQLPDVPTFAELGYKDMEISNWLGVIAPKGTPPAIVDKLNKTINRALQDADLAKRISEPGNEIAGGSPQDFANFVASESKRWSKLIKDKGIKSD